MPAAVRLRTPRLLIRRWSPDDATALSAAISASLAHLRPWLEWARLEPSPQAELVMRLDRFARDFDDDRDWPFALLTPDEQVVVGGAGLHPTGRDDTLEVGCWLCAEGEGVGLASEATAALCHEALYRRGMTAVLLRCAPHNRRAVRLAERMGFVRLDAEDTGGIVSDGPGVDGEVAFHILRRDQVAIDAPVRTGGATYDEDPA